MHGDVEDWSKEDWEMYSRLIREGEDGEPVYSQKAIRKVNARRAKKA